MKPTILPMTDTIRRAERAGCDGCGKTTAVTTDTMKAVGLLCLECQLAGRIGANVEVRLRSRAAQLLLELDAARRVLIGLLCRNCDPDDPRPWCGDPKCPSLTFSKVAGKTEAKP